MIFSFFLQELKDENGRVYKLLSERDFELRHLKKKREEEKAALASKLVCLQADIYIGLDKQKFSALNCKYFITHNFSICFGCSKEPSH